MCMTLYLLISLASANIIQKSYLTITARSSCITPSICFCNFVIIVLDGYASSLPPFKEESMADSKFKKLLKYKSPVS